MNVYDLSRVFWDYAFENPEKIKPNHIAMYFFAIEHCNRLGWKEKFGFPTTMVMDAISIKSYNTYIKTLTELVDCGFIKMIERSKNQYSANIIALSKFDKANDKALDKALIKHSTKQSESTVQSTGESIDSIDKQIYNSTNTPINQSTNSQEQTPDLFLLPGTPDTIPVPEERKKVAQKKERPEPPDLDDFVKYARETYENDLKRDFSPFEFAVRSKYESWISAGWKDGNGKPILNWKSKLKNTIPHLKAIYNNGTSNINRHNTGKISGHQFAASKLREHFAGNSAGGDYSIDVEAVEQR